MAKATGKSAGKTAGAKRGAKGGGAPEDTLLGASSGKSAIGSRGPVSMTAEEVEKAVGALSLDRVVGQKHAIHILKSALESGRVHHAWVFSGSAGVGKFTAAKAFAAELLTNLATGKFPAADRRRVMEMIVQQRHPDVHVITKELASISKEKQVRDSKQRSIAKAVVEEFLLEPASRSRCVSDIQPGLMGKVFIVDEAELMDDVTQNQVLKTLEEPPEGTALILVTSEESGLLPTVRSRCQRVSFGTLHDRDMQAWIELGEIKMPAEQSAWLLRFAAGSPGAAMLAMNNELYAWHEALEPLLATIDKGQPSPACTGLGTTLAKLIEDRALAAVEGRAGASKEAANNFWARRMLAFLAERARGQLRRTPMREQMVSCLRAIELTRQAEVHIERNVSIAAAMDNLAAQLMTPTAASLAMVGA